MDKNLLKKFILCKRSKVRSFWFEPLCSKISCFECSYMKLCIRVQLAGPLLRLCGRPGSVDGAGSRVSAVVAHLHAVPGPPHLHHVSNQQHQSLVGNQCSYLSCRLVVRTFAHLSLAFCSVVLNRSSVYFNVRQCFSSSSVSFSVFLCISALHESLPTWWTWTVCFFYLQVLLHLDPEHPNLDTMLINKALLLSKAVFILY